MNNDLISRDYVADKICDLYSDGEKATKKDRIINEVLDIIDNAPAVELDESVIQEVLNKRCMTAVANEYLIALHCKGGTPQGEWIYSHISSGYFCDKCGSYSRDKTNFCSKCGTMMQKGGAE